MANILDQLGVNNTIWIQFVIFTAAFLILKYLFFRPFLKVILERENQTEGVTKTAEELNINSATKEKEFQEKMRVVREQAAEKKDSLLSVAKAESSAKIEEARKQHKDSIEAARKKIEDELDESLNDLKDRVHGFAQLFVEKVTKVKY